MPLPTFPVRGSRFFPRHAVTCRVSPRRRQWPPPEREVVAALLVPLEVEGHEDEAGALERGHDLPAALHDQAETIRVDLDPGQVVSLIPDPDPARQPHLLEGRLGRL